MRLRSWIPLLALLGLLCPRVTAQGLEKAEREALLERVLGLGDAAPARYFYSIAEGRDSESFATLKDALRTLSEPGATRSAYGACSLFRGSPIQSSVINWLARQTFKDPQASHQLGATSALTYFWQDAETELLRIVRSHPSSKCRRAALPSVVPAIVAQGGRVACKMLLENSRGDAGDRVLVLGALRHFDSEEEEASMASVLRAPTTQRQMKLLLLDAFSRRESKIARIAIERRLEDGDEAVRLRSLRWVADAGDAETLKRLRPIALKGTPDYVVKAMLVLAEHRDGDPTWVAELYSFTQSQDRGVRLGAARALGRIPTRDALRLLHRLLKDEDLDVRLAALDQIANHHQLESVPKLISSLGAPRQLYTHQVALALRLLTGEDHGVSRARWLSWFDDKGASLQLPTTEECARLERERAKRRSSAEGGTTASFYGLKIDSNRVCFVLDTSGSMSDAASGRGTTGRIGRSTRLTVAKQEIGTALNQMLDGVRFNIITFSSTVKSYKKSLIEMNPASRKKALSEVEKWRASGGTAIYDGLRRALLDPNVETVFLLTDGVPTEGEVVAESEIRQRILQLIEGRNIRIHGIAIGQSSSLLKGLSRDSGGQYVAIL